MKNLLITIFLLINFNLFSQDYNINIEKSNIKWTGKEITTSSHYGTLKFVGGDIASEFSPTKLFKYSPFYSYYHGYCIF